jgi:hypothetical protein
MKPPPDPLDPLLDRWSELPEPPTQLSAAVWQSIATRADSAPSDWRTVIEGWFTRPAFAVGFVAGCALLGLFVAEVRISHLQRERNAQLVRSYLLLIDPLLTTPNENPQT